MPVLIKTGAPVRSSAGRVSVSEAPFKGAEINIGDIAYLWVCETSGGEGLAMRGRIESVEPTVTRHKQIELTIIDSSPNRPLGISELQPLRNTLSGDPEATLAKKLYKHSLRKIAELTIAEAAYLNTFFGEIPD